MIVSLAGSKNHPRKKVLGHGCEGSPRQPEMGKPTLDVARTLHWTGSEWGKRRQLGTNIRLPHSASCLPKGAGWSQEASKGHSRQISVIRCLRLFPLCFHHMMDCAMGLRRQINPSTIRLSLDRYFINTMRKETNTPSLSTTLPLLLTARKASQVKMNEWFELS